MVQWTPWWWAAAGCAALVAVGAIVPLSTGSLAVGVAYVVASSALLAAGQHRRGTVRFGAANAVTAVRSMLVAIVTAIVVASFADAAPTMVLASIAACALVLDAVDGFVARRTRGESALGARFDMEVDAFLLLALSAYDMRFVGWWVVAIGLMRYAFVAAGWLLPWMNATLPYRYWRKVVAAVCGVALVVVAAQIAPFGIDLTVAAVAFLLLVESFGRDVIWLAGARPRIVSDRRPVRARDDGAAEHHVSHS